MGLSDEEKEFYQMNQYNLGYNFDLLVAKGRFRHYEVPALVALSRPETDDDQETLENLYKISNRLDLLMDLAASLSSSFDKKFTEIFEGIDVSGLRRDFYTKEVSERLDVQMLYCGSEVLKLIKKIKERLEVIQKDKTFTDTGLLDSLSGWALAYEADLIRLLIIVSRETMWDKGIEEAALLLKSEAGREEIVAEALQTKEAGNHDEN